MIQHHPKSKVVIYISENYSIVQHYYECLKFILQSFSFSCPLLLPPCLLFRLARCKHKAMFLYFVNDLIFVFQCLPITLILFPFLILSECLFNYFSVSSKWQVCSACLSFGKRATDSPTRTTSFQSIPWHFSVCNGSTSPLPRRPHKPFQGFLLHVSCAHLLTVPLACRGQGCAAVPVHQKNCHSVLASPSPSPPAPLHSTLLSASSIHSKGLLLSSPAEGPSSPGSLQPATPSSSPFGDTNPPNASGTQASGGTPLLFTIPSSLFRRKGCLSTCSSLKFVAPS